MSETIMTHYGLAELRMGGPDSAYLKWPGGLQLNRVHYPTAEVRIERQKGGSFKAEPTLRPSDWQKSSTPAADKLIRLEGLRLAPELFTPERVWQAELRGAKYRVERTQREVNEAEITLWEAQDNLSAALARVQELLSNPPAQLQEASD